MVRNCIKRLSLVVMVLILLLGATSFVQASPAQGAETVVPTYGAPSYLDGSPVGGGAGYLDIIDPSEADYVVDTAAELKSALAKATSGQIVYVADGATITLNSTSNWYGTGIGFYVKAGVTLAGGRGTPGVTGGIIKLASGFYNTSVYSLIQCDTGGDVCGLNIVGPQEGTTGGNMWRGIWAGDNGEIYNNEIHGFGYAGVRVDRDITDVWIHHNYIHHNRQSGYGYGVYVSAYSTSHLASAIIEGNKFDYSRHHIAASHGRSSYILRYNYIGANCTHTQIDCHGQNGGGDGDLDKDDGEYIYPAGENIKIYNNTSKCTDQPFVGIRGIPYSTGSISVQNNWTYTTAKQEWQLSSDRPKVRTINQQMDNIPGYGYQAPNGGAFVRMTAKDNWYGTTPPPDYSSPEVNQPPATPGAPGGGTTSGKTGTSYTYSVKTTDPDGDTITYTIDWGDGTSYTTGSKSSGTTAYPGHTWTQAGTYAVKVRATDSKANVSAWSPSRSVTIATPNNQPPLTPAAPSGPVSGKTGTSYTYSVKTTDPDGDTITYTIDWGDGTSYTTGSKSSGTTAYPGHTWTQAGTYAVKVRATDSKANVSAWSPSRSVVIASAFTASQTPVTPAAPEVQPEPPTPEPPAPVPTIPAPATSAPSTPAAAPAQGTSAAVTPTVETPTESSPVGPSTATVENAGGSLSPAVGGSSAGGPQRSGFAWWLFSVSVIVGGAVLLTGAIVRDAISEPPG